MFMESLNLLRKKNEGNFWHNLKVWKKEIKLIFSEVTYLHV